MMATQIMPERFSNGESTSWLLYFDRCAAANTWNTETRLAKLPAFLHDPAAVYLDSLAEGEKDAEPELSDDAFDALLLRQFMKGLPFSICMKLLESEPTLDLDKMVSFAHRFRALNELPVGPPAPCAAVHHASVDLSIPHPDSHVVPDHLPHQSHEVHLQRLDNLERLVSNMADQQANFIAAISSSLPTNPSALSPPNDVTYPVKNQLRCFYCHEEGHTVCHCIRRRNANLCNTCGGWGIVHKAVPIITTRTIVILRNKVVSFNLP